MTDMRRLSWAMVVITLAQVWLVTAIPLQVLAHAAHDDALFSRLAIALLNGNWLGAYDSLTLAKGPFYPMWLAALAWLGLPLLLAQDLLYLFAGAVLLRLLAPRPRHWLLISALYAAYAFNPIVTASPVLRIVREGLYAPLVVLLLAMVVWWWRWRGRALWHRALPAVILGAVFAALWLTREEGLWLLPTLVTAAVVCALCSSGTGLGTRFARESGLIALALVVAWSANTAVARTNKAHYGVATVVEFREPAFVAAYGALSRLEPAAWERLIPVPREAIRRAAEHSPATAELLPYLDGAMADGWALEGCLVYDEAPCRGEIRGGWFMWALRAAVSLAGHSESAVDARRFYRRVATEIDAACNDGRLACVAKPLGMAPPFRRDYLVLAARRLVDAFHMLTGFTEAGPMRIQSSGRALELSILSDLVGGPIFPRARTVWLSGALLTSGSRIDSLTVVAADDAAVWQVVELTQRKRYDDGTAMVKFDVKTDCVVPDCRLQIIARGGVLASLRFDRLGERVALGSVTVVLTDIIDSRDRQMPRDRRTDAAFIALHGLAAAWRAAGPVLAAIAFAGFGAALVLAARARRLGTLTFLAGVMLAAVISCLALLAYLDVTALPAINTLYMSPVIPLWILFLGLAPLAAIEAWQARMASRDE